MINFLLLLLLGASGLYPMENTQEKLIVTLDVTANSTPNIATKNDDNAEPFLERAEEECIKKINCDKQTKRFSILGAIVGVAMLTMPVWVPLTNPEPNRSVDPCVTLDRSLEGEWWQYRAVNCGRCKKDQVSEVGCSKDLSAGQVYKQGFDKIRAQCPDAQICISTLTSTPYCLEEVGEIVEKYEKQLKDLCANDDQN